MPGHTDIPAVAPTMMQPMAAPEVPEAELEEGRNALRQVFQIIQVLIQQGLSEEQILEFLAQNGISEAELEEAAQVLGIDVSTLFAGTARMPMAEGGLSKEEIIPRDAIDAANAAIGFRLFQHDDGSKDFSKIYSPEQLENIIKVFYDQYEFQLNKGNQAAAKVLGDQINKLEALKIQMQASQKRMPMAAGGMVDPLAPAPVAQTPEMVIFSLQSQINNLMQDYDMAVRNDEFTRAQGIADQIDVLQQQIIAQQDSFVPQRMRLGGKVPQENLVETKLQGLASDPVMDFAMMVVGPGKFGVAAKALSKIDKLLQSRRKILFKQRFHMDRIASDGAPALRGLEKETVKLNKNTQQLNKITKNPSDAAYVRQELVKLDQEFNRFQ
tara:strand:+ start:438 stop:1586 length:1149 start_codon:yes stop_codon:yes gene_type:complete